LYARSWYNWNMPVQFQLDTLDRLGCPPPVLARTPRAAEVVQVFRKRTKPAGGGWDTVVVRSTIAEAEAVRVDYVRRGWELHETHGVQRCGRGVDGEGPSA